jgi:hypothetical protein
VGRRSDDETLQRIAEQEKQRREEQRGGIGVDAEHAVRKERGKHRGGQ